MPGALHDGPAGGAFAAHEHGDANQPFVTNHRNFGRGAVFHHIQQRNDGIDREVDVAQGVAGLVQRLAQGQVDVLQVRRQPAERLWRQGSQQVVVLGFYRVLHAWDHRWQRLSEQD
ncbi:hypothetical protein D3C79_811070 [compost metagenome]